MRIIFTYCPKAIPVIIMILLSGFSQNAFGRRGISFEFLPGGSIIMPSSLYLQQEGYPVSKFKAQYRTETFNLPIYYSVRLGYQVNKKSTFELELNHLKVILDNNPPEIEVFSITHGFNQLWANYLFNHKGFQLRVGAGPVIAHPESIVRGKRLETDQGFAKMGYYLCGVTSQFAIQKKHYFGKYFFISAETKVNAAFSQVKIADGIARLNMIALHGLIGAGINF